MIQIPKEKLHEHLGKNILVKESGREFDVVFEGIKSGWLRGFNKTNNSMIKILLSAKEGENATKYFIIEKSPNLKERA